MRNEDVNETIEAGVDRERRRVLALIEAQRLGGAITFDEGLNRLAAAIRGGALPQADGHADHEGAPALSAPLPTIVSINRTKTLEEAVGEIAERPAFKDLERLAAAANRAAARTERIETRCPSCGNTTLFIANGGHLTCSWHACKQPVVHVALAELAARLSAAREAASALAVLETLLTAPPLHDREKVAAGTVIAAAAVERWSQVEPAVPETRGRA